MAASRVGSTGYVLATDISENQIAYAREAARAAGCPQMEARGMDAEHLELEDNQFDAVISRFGLMLLPHPERALAEARRVLRGGGNAAGIVFTTPDQTPWIALPLQVIGRYRDLPAPQPGRPGLFSLGVPGRFADVLNAAGFVDVYTETAASTLRFDDADECVAWMKDAAGAIHELLAPLDAATQAKVWEEIGDELARFEGPDGFAAPTEVLIGVGTAP